MLTFRRKADIPRQKYPPPKYPINLQQKSSHLQTKVTRRFHATTSYQSYASKTDRGNSQTGTRGHVRRAQVR